MGSSVIITGGHWSDFMTKVSQYNEAGWVRDLPDLLQERMGHGCSYFYNNEGSMVRY